MPDANLSRLSHDTVQNTYKELHALLDSLGDASPEVKRTRLVDFFLSMRHRLVRLLVIVRWFMSYSAFHGSAQGTRDLANAHTLNFTLGSDRLYWRINEALSTQSAPCAISEAAEILGTNTFDRLPRIISTIAGVDPNLRRFKSKPLIRSRKRSKAKETEVNNEGSDDDDNSYKSDDDSADDSDDDDDNNDNNIAEEATSRLRLHTRRIVADCLPNGVRVISSNASTKEVPLRIGVRGMWNALVLLNSLKEKETLLRVLSIQICVDGHPDAPTQITSRKRATERPLPLRRVHLHPLREMIDDRMRWAALDVPEAPLVERMRQSLWVLCSAMSLECCGSMIMSHLREQAGAMMTLRMWREGGLVVSGRWVERGKKKEALRLDYWRRSHIQASVKLDVFQGSDEAIEKGVLEKVVDIQHYPPLPDRFAKVGLCASSLNLQQMVLDCGRIRAKSEFEKICDQIKNEYAGKVDSSIVDVSSTCKSIVVSFRGGGVGLSVGMSLTSGGMTVRPKGSVFLALGRNDELGKSLKGMLWVGEEFFRSSAQLWDKMKRIVHACNELVRWEATMRSVWGGGGGIMTTWPPGHYGVEKLSGNERGKSIRPPFAVIERKRPRCFLTLDSVSEALHDEMPPQERGAVKRIRTQHGAVAKELKHGELTFVEGCLRDGLNSPFDICGPCVSTRGMITWAELRHNAQMTLVRDWLLRKLKECNIISSWACDFGDSMACEATVEMRVSPIDVEKATVRILGDESWVLEIKLRKNTFSKSNGLHGYESCYNEERKVLQFWYSRVGYESVESCVRQIRRARSAALLAEGLLHRMSIEDGEDAKRYKIIERTHQYVMVKCSGLYLMVGLGSSKIDVEIWPKIESFTKELVPFTEEILWATAKDMGLCLAALLHLSIPMAVALEQAISREKLRFRLKFVNVLSGRLAFYMKKKNGQAVVFGLNFDALRGDGTVILSDIGRIHSLIEQKQQQKQQQEQQQQEQNSSKGSEQSGKTGDPRVHASSSGGNSNSSIVGNGPGSAGAAAMTMSPIPTWDTVMNRLIAKNMAKSVNHNTGLELRMDLLFRVVNAIAKSVILK